MVEQLIRHLSCDEQKHESEIYKIYAIFDGVKFPMLWSDLEESRLAYGILFKDEILAKELEEVAPYLVLLSFDEETIDASKELLENYGEDGTLFFCTSLELEATLQRVRDIFHIYTREGEKGYLRYYSPSIFSELIKQNDPDLRMALFDKVHAYWCEDEEDSNTLVEYRLENKKVLKTALNLKKDTHES